MHRSGIEEQKDSRESTLQLKWLRYGVLLSAGYCVLGGSYDGFSTYANAVVSCVMLTQSRWNFNSIITIPQQGRSIGWLFQVFCLVVCMFFFGFLNYIVLSMIYVRYAFSDCSIALISAHRAIYTTIEITLMLTSVGYYTSLLFQGSNWHQNEQRLSRVHL